MSGITSSISGDISNVRNTFSSWDSCMSKAYCKWPVIVGIVVGAIILLSILWCVASCLCCGATLCGSCLRCLTCFNCCGACGNRGGGGGGRTRHQDDYSKMAPSPYNGYQPPMTYQPPSSGANYAQFDASTRPAHADSLPAMPTWNTSRSVRVEDEHQPIHSLGNDVEMGRMQPSQPQPRARGGYNQVPHGPISPISAPANYDHFEQQSYPYNSDIGAQRLGQQQTGYTEFQPSPLSPAPTYRTTASAATTNRPDRFARGAMSPTPSEYHMQNYAGVSRGQAWSPPPIPQYQATDYQSAGRSLSPPLPEHQPLTHSYQEEDQYEARPPSLLMIGRKPVMGSQREV